MKKIKTTEAPMERHQSLLEFQRAVEAFRVAARNDGLDKLSMSELNREISAARKECRKRLASSPVVREARPQAD